MAKDKLTDYDATASNNTDVGGISVAEGMLPSGVNNAIRELMSHQADAFGAGTPLYVDQTNNRLGIGNAAPTVPLDVTGAAAVSGALTAASASVTGDLTVDTNTLYVDSTNNQVGIGTTSPSVATASGSANGIEINGSVPAINLNAGASDEFLIYGGSSNANILVANNNPLRIITGGSENMRIDSSGDILANTTSAGISNSLSTTIETSAVNNSRITVNHSSGGSSNGSYFMQFGYGGNRIGSITQNSTNSVAYNTSSDYRLKENVTATWDATTRLKQLNPVRFNFIADADTTVDGFLAHEVQDVVPEAISGAHNEVDDDGNPVYQGIDQSKLVPLLVKTIQELEARIAALENA